MTEFETQVAGVLNEIMPVARAHRLGLAEQLAPRVAAAIDAAVRGPLTKLNMVAYRARAIGALRGETP